MQKRVMKKFAAKIKALQARCEELATEMEEAADEYEAETETPSQEAQERLDLFRGAAENLSRADVSSAIDALDEYAPVEA